MAFFSKSDLVLKLKQRVYVIFSLPPLHLPGTAQNAASQVSVVFVELNQLPKSQDLREDC